MKKVLLAIILCFASFAVYAQQVTTFEMRYMTRDAKADGVTDFHGENEWFDTDRRVEVLNRYADFASSFWGDPELDTPLFTDAQVKAKTLTIKPQPLTTVRRTLPLEQWKSVGYRRGDEMSKPAGRKVWDGKGTRIAEGCLSIENGMVSPEIDTIGWRFSLKMQLESPAPGLSVRFSAENGGEFAICLKDIKTALQIKDVDIYGDLPNRRIFLSSEGVTLKEMTLPDSFGKVITGFSVACDGLVKIDDLSLYNFVRTPETPDMPFVTELYFDDDFNEVPSMAGWQNAGYDDSLWQTVMLPSSIGGLKSEGKSYYLRTKVMVGDFKYASLEIETLDPAGEVWVNGEIAAVLKGRQPRSIDVAEYLIPNQENTIAVRVKPYKAENTMHHAPSDLNIGWFLGRTKLVLTDDKAHIVENLVHTSSLDGDKAVQRHKVIVKNDDGASKKASIKINYYPWYPAEGALVASLTKEIKIRPRVDNVYDLDMPMDSVLVWSTDSPKLYKVEVILSDEEGKQIDDYVTTTGIRIIEQKEGVLYINGKPDMLNGAQNFGYRLPIEDVCMTIRCATDEMVMRDLMMAQMLGGNLLRVHIHAEKDIVDGVNDPRYAEYADQMGLYLIWQSAGWLREGEAWNVDIANWPAYMRQVYNHPSIVLWEASNHPNRFKRHDVSDTEDYFNAIITAISQTDTSRLISPTSYWPHSHYANYDGTKDYQGNDIAPNQTLMHKMMTRGSQDAYTGYGAKWTELRNFPYPWAKSCLDAKDLCYFNFEHEESAAQPNWNLARKDPWFEVQSYEWDYEKGSIGRLLQFNEWRASQAFQAFSAWESMKVQTYAGVCGFSWCSLESGANMFTYQKPLVDCYYVPKLAFYANRMVFGKIWAASEDVDTVYGPGDMVKPVIFNIGDGCVADLTVELRDQRGKTIEKKIFKGVNVEKGRSVTRLEPFRFKSTKEGCRFVVYRLSVCGDN